MIKDNEAPGPPIDELENVRLLMDQDSGDVETVWRGTFERGKKAFAQ